MAGSVAWPEAGAGWPEDDPTWEAPAELGAPGPETFADAAPGPTPRAGSGAPGTVPTPVLGNPPGGTSRFVLPCGAEEGHSRRHSPPVKSTRIQQALPQSIYRAPSRRPSTHFRVPVGRRAPFQEPPNRLGDPRHVQPPWRRCLRQSSSQPQRQGRKHSRQKIGQNRAPGGQAGLGRPCSAEPIAQGSTPKERWPWPCHLKQYAS